MRVREEKRTCDLISCSFSRVTLADEISKYSGSKKAISSFVTDSEKVSSNFSDIKSIFTESIYRDCDAILKSKMSWNYKNIELVVNAVLECKGTIFTTGIGKTNGSFDFKSLSALENFYLERVFLRRMITILTQITVVGHCWF